MKAVKIVSMPEAPQIHAVETETTIYINKQKEDEDSGRIQVGQPSFRICKDTQKH